MLPDIPHPYVSLNPVVSFSPAPGLLHPFGPHGKRTAHRCRMPDCRNYVLWYPSGFRHSLRTSRYRHILCPDNGLSGKRSRALLPPTDSCPSTVYMRWKNQVILLFGIQPFSAFYPDSDRSQKTVITAELVIPHPFPERNDSFGQMLLISSLIFFVSAFSCSTLSFVLTLDSAG